MLAWGVGMHLTGIDWTLATWGTLLFAVAGGVALFAGILVLQATLAFWTVESLEVANTLTYGGVEAAQYPLDIYARWFRAFLTFVVPLGCVSYYPVAAVLGHVEATGSSAWLRFTPALGFVFLGAGDVRVAVRRAAIHVDGELIAGVLLAALASARAGLVGIVAALGAGTRLRWPRAYTPRAGGYRTPCR